MQLVDEIIGILSSDTPNTEQALMKTKVLLHILGKKELVGWVNNELNGYSKDDTIPSYRIIHCKVKVTVSTFVERRFDMVAPTSHLDKDIEDYLTIVKLQDSISSIEHLAKGDNPHRAIAPEFWPKLAKGFSDDVNIDEAHTAIPKTQIISILTQVRSGLLDFLLELNDKIPEGTNDNNIKEIADRIGAGNLFKNAIFGDNATVVVGNNNAQNISNSVKLNDIKSLEDFLIDNNVQVKDIDDLKESISNDGVLNNNKIGSKVKEWMKKMLGKAIDTSWQIELGIAGNILSSAINKYYGL